MNEKTAVKNSWFAAFTVASVWFGTHVGGGFATGNQVLNYFVQYGWTAAIYPLIAMGVLAYIMYTIARFARLRGLTNYKDTFTELWQPYPKMELTFEAFYIIVILAAVAAAVSGAANLVVEFTGLSYVPSCLIVIACLVVLSVFGIRVIIAVSTFLSAAILIIVAVMVTAGLSTHMPELTTNISGELKEPLTAFIRGTAVYAGFQCVCMPSFIAASTTVSNNRGLKRASILGGLMNGLALAASSLALIAWYPEIVAAGKTTLPNLFMCESIGWQWLVLIYSGLLFCAFISTSVTLVYSMIDRFEGKLPETVAPVGRKIIVGAITIGLCFAVSLLGLDVIISKVYGMCGYISIVVILLPILVIGTKKNREFVKAHPECLDD